METGLLHLHNLLRWVILILLLISIYTTYTATNNSNKKYWLFTLIAAHTTLLIGIYQVYNYYKRITDVSPLPFKEIVKNKANRFFLVEHPTYMVLSIILITIAYTSTKKAKYKRAAILFAVALLIIIAGIPWPGRAEIGRSLMP